MESNTFAKDITWDLTDLYGSLHDIQIEKDLDEAQSRATLFQKEFKPKLENIVSNGLADFPLSELLKEYKKITILTTKPYAFAYLTFATNSKDPQAGSFLQKIQTRLTDIQSYLIFFEVYWNKLPAATFDQIIVHEKVEEDRHFLEKLRVYAPHTLTEGEENVMSVKANTGSRAFIRLFDEINNNISYGMNINGKLHKKTNSEILALQHSPRREIRRLASESLSLGLQNNSHLLTYIFNMILADHRTTLKIRHHQHPMEPMNLLNEIDLESVLHLIESVKKAYPIASKYYQLKRKLLNLETLFEYDRYAPIRVDDTKVTFDQCKEMVLSGYYNFSDEAGKIVEQFFSKRWIDAEVREGKHGGGFCSQTTPDLHPYILVNYTGSMRDVMTVAHELGHGLHQYLAGKRVGILESDAPLTMAETASVFGEMLIFDQIMKIEKNPDKRLALIFGKIDDNFATVFRQIAMTDFELKLHLEGLEKGELPEEEINNLWMRAHQEFYGDSVTLTDHYRHGWKYIPHFIHSSFYCYAYAFAQLFVLTLYHRYKKDKTTFIPQYLEMLSLGGSHKPEELSKIVGLDFSAPQFWQSGLELLNQLVNESEEIVSSKNL